MSLTPYVIEHTRFGERSYDIFSRLLKDNIVFIGMPIDDRVANIVIAQLLFLEAQDPERDIYIYINSPGGYVASGLAIYDTIQYIRPDVHTICMGQAASMAAVLLAAGKEGKRSSRSSPATPGRTPTGSAPTPTGTSSCRPRKRRTTGSSTKSSCGSTK